MWSVIMLVGLDKNPGFYSKNNGSPCKVLTVSTEFLF